MNCLCGLLVIFIAFVKEGDGACSFPADLQNKNWTSSGFGNMEFLVSNVTFIDDTDNSKTYTCHLNSGSDYVIQSPQLVEFGTVVNHYYCFQLTQVSTSSYSYYLLSGLDNISQRKKTFQNTTEVTSTSTVCDITPVVAELYVLVQQDSLSSAAVSCSSPLLGNFQYTAVTSGGGSVCGTSPGDGLLGVCDSNSTAVIYNQTTCSDVLSYSDTGVLYCIASASTTVGTTLTYYQILYNTATSPSPPFYQFTCMALSYNETNNSTVYASEIHTVCQENQIATTALTGGNLIIFTANDTCVPTSPVVDEEEEEGINIVLIVGLALLGLVVLLVIAAILFYCLYWKKREPNAGKPIVENTKPRFEDPDKEDILEDLELEDTRSEPLTRDDIVFTAESPNFLSNGNPHFTTNGHVVNTTPTTSTAKDSGISLTDFSKASDKQITPRLNRDRESMVIFNGDEKVISGNDSRVVPIENQSFRRFQPGAVGPGPAGPLTLQGLEDEYGDVLGELSPPSLNDLPYPTLPREKSNLLPPIETIDPENEK